MVCSFDTKAKDLQKSGFYTNDNKTYERYGWREWVVYQIL